MLHDDTSEILQMRTVNGDVDRPVDGRRWKIPSEVRIFEDRLYWKSSKKEVGPTKGLLEAYWRLAEEGSDQKILAFARKYGVLEICEHGLPRHHKGILCCPYLGWAEPSGEAWEPLSAWRQFATQAFALVKVSDRLLSGQLGEPKDWEKVGHRFPPGTGKLAGTVFRGARAHKADYKARSDPIQLERSVLLAIVDHWLRLGDVKPMVRWAPSDKRPSVQLGGPGLFGALALQLALAIGQTGGFAICDHCRKQYVPGRRPKTGQRHFCRECRDVGIPNRYSLADYRKRVRSEKHAQKARKQ